MVTRERISIWPLSTGTAGCAISRAAASVADREAQGFGFGRLAILDVESDTTEVRRARADGGRHDVPEPGQRVDADVDLVARDVADQALLAVLILEVALQRVAGRLDRVGGDAERLDLVEHCRHGVGVELLRVGRRARARLRGDRDPGAIGCALHHALA